jgi:hypothetical protein
VVAKAGIFDCGPAITHESILAVVRMSLCMQAANRNIFVKFYSQRVQALPERNGLYYDAPLNK